LLDVDGSGGKNYEMNSTRVTPALVVVVVMVMESDDDDEV